MSDNFCTDPDCETPYPHLTNDCSFPDSDEDSGDGEVGTYTFPVTVTRATYGQACRVMGERLGPDEDYGFDYTVDWKLPDERRVRWESFNDGAWLTLAEGRVELFGVPMHVDAYRVKTTDDGMFEADTDDEEVRENFDALHRIHGCDGALHTVTIDGAEYAIFPHPMSGA